MTKVSITETYTVGCAACVENLIRLCAWSGRDHQVTGLTFRAVPRCDHALPQAKPLTGKTVGEAFGKTVGEAFPLPTSPPTPSGQLFAVEIPKQGVAGTGYDEPVAG